MKGNLARIVPAVERELREAQVRRKRRHADEALRLAYAEPEARVQQRTAELANANEELMLRDLQKDEFLAIAARELRTPLTSMRGFTQMLIRRAERTPGVEDWVRPLRTVDSQVSRLGEIVGRLLDVSRIQAGRLELKARP